MFHEFLNTLVTDLDGRWESYRVFTAPVNWRLESGDRFELNVVPTGERLTESFEITDGVVIPAAGFVLGSRSSSGARMVCPVSDIPLSMPAKR